LRSSFNRNCALQAVRIQAALNARLCVRCVHLVKSVGAGRADAWCHFGSLEDISHNHFLGAGMKSCNQQHRLTGIDAGILQTQQTQTACYDAGAASCHRYTDSERAIIYGPNWSPRRERQVCHATPGQFFTGGNNAGILSPSEDCWCCQVAGE
jgi:hypothetical protein